MRNATPSPNQSFFSTWKAQFDEVYLYFRTSWVVQVDFGFDSYWQIVFCYRFLQTLEIFGKLLQCVHGSVTTIPFTFHSTFQTRTLPNKSIPIYWREFNSGTISSKQVRIIVGEIFQQYLTILNNPKLHPFNLANSMRSITVHSHHFLSQLSKIHCVRWWILTSLSTSKMSEFLFCTKLHITKYFFSWWTKERDIHFEQQHILYWMRFLSVRNSSANSYINEAKASAEIVHNESGLKTLHSNNSPSFWIISLRNTSLNRGKRFEACASQPLFEQTMWSKTRAQTPRIIWNKLSLLEFNTSCQWIVKF